jgi:hypothetical protein
MEPTTKPPEKPRPLEDRFPNLYDEIVDERNAGTGKVEQKRTPRVVLPSIRDVVARVLASHGIHDSAVASDLLSAIKEFQATGTKLQPPPPEPTQPATPSTTKRRFVTDTEEVDK